MYVFKLSDLGEDKVFVDKVLSHAGKKMDMFKINLTPEQETKYGIGPWYDKTSVETILDNYEDKVEEHDFEAFVSLRFTLFNISIDIK